MSIEIDAEIKRWTTRRKSALVLDIIQGKTNVSESSRQFDLPPSEIKSWIDQAKAGMENRSGTTSLVGLSTLSRRCESFVLALVNPKLTIKVNENYSKIQGCGWQRAVKIRSSRRCSTHTVQPFRRSGRS